MLVRSYFTCFFILYKPVYPFSLSTLPLIRRFSFLESLEIKNWFMTRVFFISSVPRFLFPISYIKLSQNIPMITMTKTKITFQNLFLQCQGPNKWTSQCYSEQTWLKTTWDIYNVSGFVLILDVASFIMTAIIKFYIKLYINCMAFSH